MVRAHIFFSGHVQGVGFRYTTVSFAHKLGLTGWVKNLSDGRVEAVVEGPRESIEELLIQLKSHFGAYLHYQDIEWKEVKGDSHQFVVMY